MAGREQVIQQAGQIVTVEPGHLGRQAETISQLGDLAGEPRRVEAARIRDDPDPPVQHGTQHLLQLDEEGTGVAGRGVFPSSLPQDQHRQFGEIVTGDDVHGTALHDVAHRREPVAVETRRVRDPQRCHGRPPARRRYRQLPAVRPAGWWRSG